MVAKGLEVLQRPLELKQPAFQVVYGCVAGGSQLVGLDKRLSGVLVNKVVEFTGSYEVLQDVVLDRTSKVQLVPG